jgi:hypothetical protein
VSDNGLLEVAGLTALNLAILNLSGCCGVSHDGLHTRAGLTNLTILDLGHWHLSDDMLRTLASLTALTSLDLGECIGLSDDGLHALDGLTSLVDLDLAYCKRVFTKF